jgi:hypothetical protein
LQFRDDSGTHFDAGVPLTRSRTVTCTSSRVYAARTVPFGTSAILIASNPVDAYWLKIDSQSMANARLRGKADDRVELNLMERRLAYGITCSTAVDGGDVRRR